MYACVRVCRASTLVHTCTNTKQKKKLHTLPISRKSLICVYGVCACACVCLRVHNREGEPYWNTFFSCSHTHKHRKKANMKRTAWWAADSSSTGSAWTNHSGRGFFWRLTHVTTNKTPACQLSNHTRLVRSLWEEPTDKRRLLIKGFSTEHLQSIQIKLFAGTRI